MGTNLLPISACACLDPWTGPQLFAKSTMICPLVGSVCALGLNLMIRGEKI